MLGIPLLQSYTTEERRKLLIARSVVWSFCSAGALHGKEWLGAGNWRKRLSGDGVLREITAQKDLSFLLLCGEVGVVEILSLTSLLLNFLSLIHACACSANVCEMKTLSFECAWRNCMEFALPLEGTEL